MFRRRKQRSWIFARSVLAPWLVRELSPLERSFVYVLIEYLMRKHGNNNPDEKKYFVLFIEERDENVENSHWRFSAYIYIFFFFFNEAKHNRRLFVSAYVSRIWTKKLGHDTRIGQSRKFRRTVSSIFTVSRTTGRCSSHDCYVSPCELFSWPLPRKNANYYTGHNRLDEAFTRYR